MDNLRRLRSDSIGPSPTEIKIKKIKRPTITYGSNNHTSQSQPERIPKTIGFEPSSSSSNNWTKICWEKISYPFRRLSSTQK